MDNGKAKLTLWQPERVRGDGSESCANWDIQLGWQIVRPSLFHLAQVSGILVNEEANSSSGPGRGWYIYAQTSEGDRACVPLTEGLMFPDGEAVLFRPRPSFMPLDEPHRWSPAGRQEFLDGYTPDPADLYFRIRQAIVHHIAFPRTQDVEGELAVIVLWCVLTYLYPAWPVVPYLAIGGHWGSAKTKLLSVLECLAFNALLSVDASISFVFRMLNESAGVLLVDEAEMLESGTAKTRELLRILNAGYKSGGRVHRVASLRGVRRPESFDVFGPKAIAGIGGLPSTLESRCVRLTMARAAEQSPQARRWLSGRSLEWSYLRDDLHIFALDRGATAVQLAKQADLCPYGNRDFELWQPLLAVALLFEGAGVPGLVATVRAFADDFRDSREISRVPAPDQALLRQLAVHVRANRQRHLTPGSLLGAVARVHPDVFGAWTAEGVANTLLPYGLRTAKSNGKRVFSKVTAEDLKRVQELYGVDLGF